MIDWTKPIEVVRNDGRVGPASVRMDEAMGSCVRVYEKDRGRGPWWAEVDTGEIKPNCGFVRNPEPYIATAELVSQDYPTLRDRFAMAALGSVFRHTTAQEWTDASDQENFIAEAQIAYQIADDMMKAREE